MPSPVGFLAGRNRTVDSLLQLCLVNSAERKVLYVCSQRTVAFATLGAGSTVVEACLNFICPKPPALRRTDGPVPSNLRKEKTDRLSWKMRQHPNLVRAAVSILTRTADRHRSNCHKNVSNDFGGRRLDFSYLVVADIEVSQRAVATSGLNSSRAVRNCPVQLLLCGALAIRRLIRLRGKGRHASQRQQGAGHCD